MGKILSWKFPRWWGFCWRNPLCRGSIPSPKVFPPCPLTPSPSTHRLMFLLMYTFLCILSYMYRNEKRKWQNLSIFAKLVLFRLLGFFVSPSLSSSQIIKFWTKQYYCTQRKAWFHCLARVNVFSPNSELVTFLSLSWSQPFLFICRLSNTVSTSNYLLTFYLFYSCFVGFLFAWIIYFQWHWCLPFSPFDCYHCAPRVPLSPCLPISQSSNSLFTIVVNTTPPTTPHQPNQRRF